MGQVAGIQEHDGGVRWFGESWGALITQDTPHILTPVGLICGTCGDDIRLGDQGLAIPTLFALGPGYSVHHIGCFLRSLGLSSMASASADSSPN